MFILSIAIFMLQWQSWVVVTETKWPAKLKVFTAVTILSMLSTSLYRKSC